MAAQLVDKLPEAQAWLYELKFDGYRALVIKDGAPFICGEAAIPLIVVTRAAVAQM
jgi:hypothetical protein